MGAACAGPSDEILSLDSLIDALAQYERFGAQIALAAAELDVSGVWGADGSCSMAAWLRNHTRLSQRDASRLLREGRFLYRHQSVADAAVSGLLSSSQVAALRAVVTRPTRDLFDEHQEAVIDAVTDLNAGDTETVCQSWRQKAEAIVDMPPPKVPERSLKTSRLEDGTVVGRFVFDPTAGAQLEAALETARAWDGPKDQRTSEVRNADAMVEILAFFNGNHAGEGTRRHRPHIELFVEASQLDALLDGCAVTADGTILPSWATDAFLCDCVVHRVLRAGAAVLDYGERTRTVPLPLWRAVAARDRGCRFPGCNRKKAWCDAHHIRWWRKHGETKLDNLILMCNYHHHLVHRERWEVRLDPITAVATFTSPDGTIITSQPRGVPTIRAA